MTGPTIPADQDRRISGTIFTFQVFGIPVRLHVTFLLVAAVLLLSGLGQQRSSIVYVLYVAGLFASLLLHEMGHVLVTRKFGVRTLEIVMFPIGGVARLDRRLQPSEEIAVATAGPLVNMFLAGACWVLATVNNHIVSLAGISNSTDDNLGAQLFFGNLAMAAFNLLPAFPMDGGRILRSVLARYRPADDATRIATWVGRMTAISMALYGLFSGHYLLVIASFFLYLGAAQEAAAALGRVLTSGIPVRAAMVTEFHTLSHNNTVREAIQMSISSSQQDFPVMHGGEISGLLSRGSLMRALAAEGPDAYVVGIMDRDFISLTVDNDLAAVLPVMARAAHSALVLQDQKLVGLLTADNLSHFLALRRFGLDPEEHLAV
ncbi:MAG: CBS domain-containing protein [Acidobacteria bacterium]|nr:CBS domain-containing protein [Acidobacteriota bacterium]